MQFPMASKYSYNHNATIDYLIGAELEFVTRAAIPQQTEEKGAYITNTNCLDILFSTVPLYASSQRAILSMTPVPSYKRQPRRIGMRA